MKNYIKFIILLIAVCLTAGLFLLNYLQSNSKKATSERELYQMGGGLNEKFAGHQLADIICADSMGNTFHLSDLLAGKKALIYFYSELHCNSCYESQLDFLEQNVSGKDFPVLILGSYLNFRHFAVYIKRHSCSLPVYCIEHNAFKWELDNLGVPYFFVLNADLTTSYFYVPQNEYQHINKLYLDGVKQLLLE